MLASPANAQGIDPLPEKLIEGAKLCTKHLQHYEKTYGMPENLLSAIATTESGRYNEKLKMRLPWPWTINAEGKGYFFDTKEQAIAAAQKLRARGVQSFDVGCMQVNLFHHAHAFSSLEQAFEPENNIAYAASFLQSLYKEEGNWKQAAGDYHSKTPSLGNEYIGLVYNSWRNILDKLRAARLSVADNSVNELAEMGKPNPATPSSNSYAPPAPKMMVLSNNGTQAKSFPLPKRGETLARNHVNSSGKSIIRSKENGIIIVRPEIKVVSSSSITPQVEQNRAPEPMVMADANPIPQQAKIIRLDNRAIDRTPVNTGVNAEATASLSSEPAKKTGPNFIFND